MTGQPTPLLHRNKDLIAGLLKGKPMVNKPSSSWICFLDAWKSKHTPPKTNMEPTNEGLEDVSPFQMGDFQVPC